MDGDKDGILEGSTHVVSHGTPNGLMIYTDEGIILGYTDDEVPGYTL